MRPPRLPNLLTHIAPRSPSLPIHHNQPHYLSQRLLSSTTPPSSLLFTTHTIPAPHLGHIKILSLNNPRSRNAISRALLEELGREIRTVRDEWEGDEKRRSGGGVVGAGTRVLVLASQIDGVFCAGADLKERKGMSSEETTTFLTTLRSTFSLLSALPIPTISAVSSVALGGGLELALATTLRIFAPTATVGLPETRLGIIPGAGGTYRLKTLIGEAKATEMILTGRRVAGAEAYNLGICERLLDLPPPVDGKPGVREREAVLEAAIGLATEICEGGPGSVGAALRAVRGGKEEVENREYDTVVGMEDRDEALRAFGEKRRAVFRGR